MSELISIILPAGYVPFKRKPDLKAIIFEAVCEFFNLKIEIILTNKSRQRKHTGPRHLLMKLFREHEGDFTLKDVGEIFGYDHTTVISAIKTINNRIDTEEDYRLQYFSIKKLIQSKINNFSFNN